MPALINPASTMKRSGRSTSCSSISSATIWAGLHGGSVRVDEYMAVETYAHVHHIVSNVSGRLRDGVSPVRRFARLFPGGTITGCPKVRCMEIIAELEGVGRGAYTGSIGYSIATAAAISTF